MFKQGEPGWLIERAGKINSSNCAAFERQHKFSKPLDVVRESVRALSGAESEFKGNQFIGERSTNLSLSTDSSDSQA